MNLVNKLRKGLKRTVLVGTAVSVLGFSSCPMPTPPKPNNVPTAILNVNPIEGYAPLETLIQADGADLDGKEDIVEYRIGEDENYDGDIDDYGELIKSSPNPINETVIFNTSGIKKIYGQVMDSKGAVGKAGPISIDVSLAPGDPTVDLTGVNTDLLEEVETTINLPTPTDPNPEDNPVPYTTYIDKISTDGQVTSTLEGNTSDGYQLIITGKTDKTGSYQINLEFGSPEGGIGNATLEGIITNLLDISGRLEDNVKDDLTNYTGKEGIVKAYSSDGTTLLGDTTTDANGNFKFQLEQIVSEVLLKARIMQNDSPVSFERKIMLAENEIEGFRTIPFSGQDITGLILRASPYEQILAEGITPEQYKTHMGEVNLEEWYPVYGLTKFDWDNFQGIEIENQHPGGTEFGTFIPEKQTHYRDKILKPTDIGGYLHGRTINIQLDDSNSTEHYDRYGEGEDTVIIPHDGWIVIIPDNDIPGIATGLTSLYDTDSDGKVDRVRILIQDQGDPIFTKEMTRAFLGMTGDSTVLSSGQTIMIPSPILTEPRPIDYRSAYDIDEPNYQAKENIDNIFGL